MRAFQKVYFWFFLVAFVVNTCNCLCHNPCNYIENRRFTDGEITFEYSCQNTSEALIYDNKNGDLIGKEICIQSSGPFILYKWEPMDMYDCFLDPVIDKTSRIIKGFSSGLKRYDTEPDICTACTGPFEGWTGVSDERLLPRALRHPYPPMPCNRPSFCPTGDIADDTPCTRGEYRFLSNRENCCKDGKRRRKSRLRRYTYGYRG